MPASCVVVATRCALLFVVVVAACADPAVDAPRGATEAAAGRAPQIVEGFASIGDTFEAHLSDVRVSFDGGQLAWSREHGSPLSLETVFIGREPGARAIGAAARLEGAELAIDRGAAVEHLRMLDDAVHQTFRFAGLPPGDGPLEVRIRVQGAEHVGTSVSGEHFVSSSGIALAYGAATFVDANGQRTPVELRVEGDELVLDVDAAVLVSTTWPAVLDPIITVRRCSCLPFRAGPSEPATPMSHGAPRTISSFGATAATSLASEAASAGRASRRTARSSTPAA